MAACQIHNPAAAVFPANPPGNLPRFKQLFTGQGPCPAHRPGNLVKKGIARKGSYLFFR